MKRCIADGSVRFPHVRVGHRQDKITNPLYANANRGFVYVEVHEFSPARVPTTVWYTEFLDDHRALEPPDPIPNSVVKRCIADGSVGFLHVRVGHRQD